MAYSFEGRIRFSEIGEDGCLTLPGLLDYFQDCCNFQAASIGHDMDDVRRRGRAWVLNSWQVIVNRLPRMGEHVITTTMPYELRGFWGFRNFTMDTDDGERLSYANTIWTNLNLATGLPEKLTEADTSGYVLDERLDMEYAPRKILPPAQQEPREPFVIQKYHLDTNHHVNNCQYIRMAEEFLPDGFVVRQMRAEYRQQAHLNDVLYPGVVFGDDRVTVVLNDNGGKPCTIVEFYG